MSLGSIFLKTDKFGDIKPRILRILLAAVILIIVMVQFPFGTIPAGHRGVLLRFNAVTGTIFDEGLYFRIPFIQSIVKMDCRVEISEVPAAAASSDLQTVTSTVAINYHLDPPFTAGIYKDVGNRYRSILIAPALQETFKASTAKFTAEELITKRAEVREQIKSLLRERLISRGLIVDEVNIVNFDFSRTFNDAIEAKVTAEQQALAAKNKLEQIKYEAQQAIETAKGKAEALRVEASAIRENPQILELRALEKWNGVLPYYLSSTGQNAIPFLDIKK